MIGDGTRRQYLYYDPTWNSLLPHPESYGMALNLNDHHFGNGYLLHAAAIVGQYAPLINNQPWSDPNRYGQAVDLLHQETVTLRGNASDPDLIFSPLKYFDPFAGHGWADGNGFVADGNDEESASEGLNHAAGVMHWGAAKGDTGLRDLGIFMSASYREAIHAYWFDIDRQNFPDSQQLGTAPRFFQVFQDGVKYATYFGADPESYLAIECIPGSPETLLHYAGSADVIQKLLDPVAQDYLGGRSIDQVRPPKYASPVLMFLALKDPAAALKAFEAIADNNQWESSNNQDNEWSFTIPYHFIAGLNALGLPDPSVKSTNHPFFRVFLKDNVRTYAAYNPTSVPIDVHFSDGTTVTAISGEVTMLQKSIAAKPE
jgi:endoglucanase Acf2